jgi:hypothetical protein
MLPAQNNQEAVHTLTFSKTPTTGSFKLNFNGVKTSALAYNASNGDIKTAIESVLTDIVDVDVDAGIQSNGKIDIAIKTAKKDDTGLTYSDNTLKFLPSAATRFNSNIFHEPNVDVVIATTQEGSPTQDEIQSIVFTGTPDGGEFVLRFRYDDKISETTPAIPYNADSITVTQALEAAPHLGAGNVVVSGNNVSGYEVEFVGALANRNLNQMTVEKSDLEMYETVTISHRVKNRSAIPMECLTNEYTGMFLMVGGGPTLIPMQNLIKLFKGA